MKKYPEFKSYVISADTPLNKNFLKAALSLLLIIFSVIRSIIIIKKEKPNLVFGFGGYVSFPFSFASKFFSLPLAIYENNIVIGKANKYLLPFAKKIFLAKEISSNLPKRHGKKISQVGSILNKNIINFSLIKKNHNNKNFSFLVLGGSQGAEIFGNVVPSAIKMLQDYGYEIEINQQCLKTQKKSLIEFYEKNKIKNNIFEFSDNIVELISSSDLAITRGGASTIAELACTFTPFITVPIPNSINNHQYLNAKYYEEKGLCWLLPQNEFNSKKLFKLILEIMQDEQKLKNIREGIQKKESKNVYNNIENEIKKLI
tara:strand:- start:885 stop:1832 length:948 start_codon:yes stop_codon:yes gene_type:complete